MPARENNILCKKKRLYCGYMCLIKMGLLMSLLLCNEAVALSPGEFNPVPLNKKGQLDIIAIKGMPDYVSYQADRALHGHYPQFAYGNFKSFAVIYKGWNLIGEYAHSAGFFWELNPDQLFGKRTTVKFQDISKYPDLVKRYNAIAPVRVNMMLNVIVQTEDKQDHNIFLNVKDNDLVYFGSRSNQNYISPTSPPKWRNAISTDFINYNDSRFTDRDPSQETELKRIISSAVAIKLPSNQRQVVNLDVEWPDEAIDEIARLYEQYEKGQPPSPVKRVAAEAVKGARLSRRTTNDFWANPTEIPVKIALDKDFNGSSTKEGVIELAGKVTGPSGLLHKGKLVAEGYEQEFDIDSAGRFRSQVVLKSGTNNVKIVVGGKTVEQMVRLDREPTALRVTLAWNTGNSDIDLHLVDPEGRDCFYQAKNVGGMALDVDNTRGYGPENIYVKQTLSGTYTVRVINYARGVGTEATVYVFVGEKLRDMQKVRFTENKQMINVGQYRF